MSQNTKTAHSPTGTASAPTTGALITAAGMSSRMGEFKPLLNIGSISISRRIIANFRQAGISKIVMITGCNAEALEHHLAGQNIIFLRNENYETTDMFDSVKIGLSYLTGKVDRILFTPVDVPLFTSSTVDALLASGAGLARPVCSGKIGHPILIDSSLAGTICSYTGEGGLRGAMDHCGTPVTEIEVDDEGTVHDADTPEDYLSLLDYHNSRLIRPEITVSLARELPFFDEKMAMLLTLVGETGSVRTACSRMRISYSKGWNVIRTLESQLSRPLLLRTQGGSTGGRSDLTDDGKKLTELYSAYSEELRRVAAENFDRYFGEFFNER